MGSSKVQASKDLKKGQGVRLDSEGKATPILPTEKTEKPRGKNGGKRPGSGRKPLLAKDLIAKLEAKIKRQGAEIVSYHTMDNKIIRTTRIQAVMMMLWEKATRQHDVPAAKEYLDRNLGKPKQPIVGGGEDEEPIAFDLTGRALATLKDWVPKK